MKFNDAVSGMFFIIFGGLLFVVTKDFPTMPGQNYGPDLFPRLIGAFMIIGGAVLVQSGVRQAKTVPWTAAMDWMSSPRHIANFAIVIGTMIFYIVASDYLGFLITAFVCLFVLIAWLRGMQTWLSSAAISLASTIVIQMFFGHFLRVPLPWGLLTKYSW